MCGALVLTSTSCSLDEVNPSDTSLNSLTATPAGFELLINNCYFGMERRYYSQVDFMKYMEGNTDLWTSWANDPTDNSQFFKFYADAVPPTTFTNDMWNNSYDGIGACNICINGAASCSFASEEERNAKVAEAYFLRGLYYYNLVEIFGGVVMLTQNETAPNYSPVRTEPIEIYRNVIIPDFRFAAKYLPVGNEKNDMTPPRKAALGYLAKACLATQQYGTTEFLAEGFQAAKDLISDCEAGGANLGAYMYPDYKDVFKEENNLNNKEALWKYTIVANSSGHGASNGNHNLNCNDQHFLCHLSILGAWASSEATIKAWDGGTEGKFMPTRYLLNLYVQADGSLDPRFEANFITQWNASRDYVWTEGDAAAYGKNASIKGTKINKGDLAYKFVMPQFADYATEIANKANSNYLLIDYKDVYDDAKNDIIMKNGANENKFRYYYPSLNKHCSSHYFDANIKKARFGNTNAVFPMRMAEIYLIAAEYDILTNGGANAMGYINKVRQRAGATPLSGAATIRTVLDERGRELCGEFTRFYDLKRTGMFKDASYLQETHPDLAQHFKPEYALRPVPQAFTDLVATGASFINPGY